VSIREVTDLLPDAVTLRAGEERSFRLPGLASAGYTWQATVDDETVARASTEFAASHDPQSLGATFSRDQVLRVRGVQAGATRVHLREQRSWERDTPIAAHSLTVNVIASDPGAKEQPGRE
jgi:predicted secreted protein